MPKRLVKILVIFTGIFALMFFLYHNLFNYDSKQLLSEYLNRGIDNSIKIRQFYRKISFFEHAYVYKLSHEKIDQFELKNMGFSQGGEPGVDVTISLIEDITKKPVGRLKKWTFFRKRIKGQDLYFILSQDKITSYLLVQGY